MYWQHESLISTLLEDWQGVGSFTVTFSWRKVLRQLIYGLWESWWECGEDSSFYHWPLGRSSVAAPVGSQTMGYRSRTSKPCLWLLLPTLHHYPRFWLVFRVKGRPSLQTEPCSLRSHVFLLRPQRVGGRGPIVPIRELEVERDTLSSFAEPFIWRNS